MKKPTGQRVATTAGGVVALMLGIGGIAVANSGGNEPAPPAPTVAAKATATTKPSRPIARTTTDPLTGRVTILEKRADEFDGRLRVVEDGDDVTAGSGETTPAPMRPESKTTSPDTEESKPEPPKTTPTKTTPARPADKPLPNVNESDKEQPEPAQTSTTTRPAKPEPAAKPSPDKNTSTSTAKPEPSTSTATTRAAKPEQTKPEAKPAPTATEPTKTAEPTKTSTTPDPLTGRVTALEDQARLFDSRLQAVENDGQAPSSPAPVAPSSNSSSPAGEEPEGDRGESDDSKTAEKSSSSTSPAESTDEKPEDGKDQKADKPATPVVPPAATNSKKPAAKTGEVVFPKTGKPSDPGNKKVISPNPSPLIPAAKLTGPKITVKKGDDLAAIFDKPLNAGTVVELPRDAVYTKPITITGKGTEDQPVLVTAADGPGELPTFTPDEVGNKNAGMITTRGDHVQVSELRIAGGEPKIGFDLGAKKGVADNLYVSGAVNGVWIRDGDQGGTGEGTRVWNSEFEDLRMQVGMDGAEDDYGATAIAVEANNVTAEGITGRNLISQPPGTPGDSPDYNKFGGDGALFEGWRKIDNFRGAHSAVKHTPRVFEAGGMPGDGKGKAVISGVYADRVTDAAFHTQEGGGPYGGLETELVQVDNNITEEKGKDYEKFADE